MECLTPAKVAEHDAICSAAVDKMLAAHFAEHLAEVRRLSQELRADIKEMMQAQQTELDILRAAHMKTHSLLQDRDSGRSNRLSAKLPRRDSSSGSLPPSPTATQPATKICVLEGKIAEGDLAETTGPPVGDEPRDAGLRGRSFEDGLSQRSSSQQALPAPRMSTSIGSDTVSPGRTVSQVQSVRALSKLQIIEPAWLRTITSDLENASMGSISDGEEDEWERCQVDMLATNRTDSRRSFVSKRSMKSLVEGFLKPQVVWEWRRSDESWAPYQDFESRRIEAAFWSGRSVAYIKSGLDGMTPMEIYFQDMVQVDPMSGRIRQIRRSGHREHFCLRFPIIWLWRHVSAMLHELATGEPQFESLNEHRKRLLMASNPHIHGEHHVMRTATIDLTGVSVSTNRASAYPLAILVSQSFAFGFVSITATVLQSLWVMTSVDQFDQNTTIWDQTMSFILIEYSFFLFFALELFVRYLALNKMSDGLRDGWFVFDAVCVIFALVETIVIPALHALGAYQNGQRNGQVIRILRIGRVFRFFNLFRQFHDLKVVVKGALSGLRSALYVWLLLSSTLFIFGAILFVNVQNDYIRETWFSSLWESMQTLFLSGILLDGIRILWNDLYTHDEVIPLILIFSFEFVAYFGLLNMLIGSFCNAAMQVSEEEASGEDLKYLQLNLKDILDCYLADGMDTLTVTEFRLIMQNMQVHRTLTQCGTDVEALYRLEPTLFPDERAELTFNELFQVIMRLRASKPASVSHLVSLTTLVQQRFDLLERLMLSPADEREEELTEMRQERYTQRIFAERDLAQLTANLTNQPC